MYQFNVALNANSQHFYAVLLRLYKRNIELQQITIGAGPALMAA